MNRLVAAKAAVAVAALTSVLLVSGCGPDVYDLPLPGTGVGGRTIHVNAQFADALNLALGAKVEVNGLTVGRVQSVVVDGNHADADLELQTSADLRRGASARLRYNTPLGELFVDMKSPDSGPLLVNGDTLSLGQTSTAPTVEDALAAASLLINGGGLDQLKTITDEFPKAFPNRGAAVRDLIDRTSRFLSQANAATSDANAALTALDAASKVLKNGNTTINAALREVGPAAAVIRAQTPQVVHLLQKATTLVQTADRLVQRNGNQILSSIRQSGPIFDTFYSLRSQFRPGLNSLLNIINVMVRVVPGDWGPVEPMVVLNQTSVPHGTGSSGGGGGSSPPPGGGLLPGSGSSGGLLGQLLGGLL